MPTYSCKHCSDPFEGPEEIKFGKISIKPNYCPKCIDALTALELETTKAKKAAMKDTKRKEREQEWTRICPPLYLDSDMQRLPTKPTAKVLCWKLNSKGLIVHGPTGRGKTRACFLLLRRLFLTDMVTVEIFHANRFAHECAVNFGNQCGEDWIKRLSKVPVLFLDDVGKFKLTERVESELFGLVELRAANLKPIIATTNFVGDTLQQKLTEDRGGPLVRRLKEFCDSVNFV